ncbi:MAG: hypothetical protein ACE5HD_02945 [Acidobacteriota bacterium]
MNRFCHPGVLGVVALLVSGVLPASLAGPDTGKEWQSDSSGSSPDMPAVLLSEGRHLHIQDRSALHPPVELDSTGRVIPPAIDLDALDIRVAPMTLGARGPEPVLVIQLAIGASGSPLPPGATYAIYLGFGNRPAARREGDGPQPGEIVLQAMVEAARQGRRRGSVSGIPPAITRFQGMPGLGGLSSFIPGQSFTFRIPLVSLAREATDAQKNLARNEDGTWTFSVWTRSRLGKVSDRLPDMPVIDKGTSRAAHFRVPAPLPRVSNPDRVPARDPG